MRSSASLLVLIPLLCGCGCRSEISEQRSAPDPEPVTERPAKTSDQPAEPPQEPNKPSKEPKIAAPDPSPSETPDPVIQRLRTGNTRKFRITRGSRWAIADVGNSTIQVFDSSNGRVVLERSLRPGRLTDINPSGRRVLVQRKKQTVLVNIWADEVVRRIPTDGRAASCFTQDGTRTVILDATALQLWERHGTSPTTALPHGLEGAPHSILADERGRTVMAIMKDANGFSAHAYGGDGGKRWRALPTVTGGPGVLSESGRLLLAPLGALKVQLVDTWHGEQRTSLPYRTAYAFRRKDKAALLGDGARTLALVDLETLEAEWTFRADFDVLGAALDQRGQTLTLAGESPGEHRLVRLTRGAGPETPWHDRARFDKRWPRLEVASLRWSAGGERLAAQIGRASLVIDGLTGQRSSASTPAGAFSSGELAGFVDGQRLSSGPAAASLGPDVVTFKRSGDVDWSRRLTRDVRSVIHSADERTVMVLDIEGSITAFSDAGKEAWSYHPADDEPLLRQLAPAPSTSSVLAVRGTSLVWMTPQTGVVEVQSDLPRALRAPMLAASTRSVALVDSRRAWSIDSKTLKPTGSIRLPFRTTAIALHNERLAVTDGTDIAVLNLVGGQVRATVVPVPDLNAITIKNDRISVDDRAGSHVRWRSGISLMSGSDPAQKALWTTHRIKIPL